VGAGYQVYAVARDLDRIKSVYASEIAAGEVRSDRLDITDASAVDAFFENRFPPGASLDLLFNNADRFGSIAPLWDSDVEDWWNDVTVNVRGTFLVTGSALGVMRRQGHEIIVSTEGGRPPAGSGYASPRPVYDSSPAASPRSSEKSPLPFSSIPPTRVWLRPI
jgi:NADP-dependent 3-hydroxy acid dehydrogenase YdfG